MNKLYLTELSMFKTVRSIDNRKSDTELLPSQVAWFAYDFFDVSAYMAPESWREKQVIEWIGSYGLDFFAGLDLRVITLPSHLQRKATEK